MNMHLIENLQLFLVLKLEQEWPTCILAYCLLLKNEECDFLIF